MDVDSQLKQLAVAAQSYPPRTLSRQKALSRLLVALQGSGKLVRPYRGQFGNQYGEIYAEAQQRLFLYMCEAIERYDPNLEVLQWANFLLRQRFFIEASRDILSGFKNRDRERLTRISLEVLDKKEPLEAGDRARRSLSEEVRHCIEEDCEGLFGSAHVAKHPAANFRFIAMRILAGYSWKEISAELQVKVPTLSSFYQRCLTRFAPKFREYLS